MKKLTRLVKLSGNYQAFEAKAIKFMRWYEIPMTWTKRDLQAFYQNNGGK